MERSTMELKGWVRIIECDGVKYPTLDSVDVAIARGDAIVSPWVENLNPLAAKEALARRIANAGIKTNEGMITYGAVGTGTGTPLSSNTKLGTELFRKAIAVASYSSNIATFRMFMTTAEGNGTLTEYGLFGEDASASADTGTLFQRVIISKTKTSAKTLTIESRIQIG